MESFAERLKEEIEYQGVTRKELAYKADIKVRALDMYLGTQASMPPADVAVRLAKALNVTVEYLVTGEKGEKNENFRENPVVEKQLKSLSPSAKQFIEKTIRLFSEDEAKKESDF